MPEIPAGARVTPLNVPGIMGRAVEAARYVVTGVNPGNWFGPFNPLPPMAPQDQGFPRGWDYSTGINLNYIPRATENISFAEMRALSRACEVLRIVIETVKNQLVGLDWVIRPREALEGYPSNLWVKKPAAQTIKLDDNTKTRIQTIIKFLQYPDREHTWDQWLRMWLDDLLVIDAPTIYRRRTRGNKLYSLELIDGATIKPVIGLDGRRAPPPSPAFQQILHGIVAADFTSEEMLYLPDNPNTHGLYGFSPVEQIIITVNTQIRRALHQLEFYRTGSLPDSFVGLPKEWNLQNIKDFQNWFDAMMSGNLAARRKVRFMPGEFKYQETKPIDMKDLYDEWLARIICFAFAVSPEPFVQHVNRSTQQGSQTRALQEGLAPRTKSIKNMIDRIIIEDFNSPDLEFAFLDDREMDPSAQTNQDVAYAKAGIKAIDEVRRLRGLEPLGPPFDKPMLATAQGYIPLGTTSAVLAAHAQAELMPDESESGGTETTGTEDAPSEADRQGVKQQGA